MARVSSIFDQCPSTWGLRGDPLLWDEMRKHFDNINLPLATGEFNDEFRIQFKNIVSAELGTETMTLVKHYNKEGMSGGMVSHGFWIEKGLPLLISRIEVANAEKDRSNELTPVTKARTFGEIYRSNRT